MVYMVIFRFFFFPKIWFAACLHASRTGLVINFMNNTPHWTHDTHENAIDSVMSYYKFPPTSWSIHRFTSLQDSKDSYGPPRNARRRQNFSYSCQTSLSQTPVSLRKASIWVAVQSKLTHKNSWLKMSLLFIVNAGQDRIKVICK
jgi:hypothetical protein